MWKKIPKIASCHHSYYTVKRGDSQHYFVLAHRGLIWSLYRKKKTHKSYPYLFQLLVYFTKVVVSCFLSKFKPQPSASMNFVILTLGCTQPYSVSLSVFCQFVLSQQSTSLFCGHCSVSKPSFMFFQWLQVALWPDLTLIGDRFSQITNLCISQIVLITDTGWNSDDYDVQLEENTLNYLSSGFAG